MPTVALQAAYPGCVGCCRGGQGFADLRGDARLGLARLIGGHLPRGLEQCACSQSRLLCAGQTHAGEAQAQACVQGKADENGRAGGHGRADKAVVVVDAVMFVCQGFSRMSRKPCWVALSDTVFQHISDFTQREQALDFKA